MSKQEYGRLLFSKENLGRLKSANKVIAFWVLWSFVFGYIGGAFVIAIGTLSPWEKPDLLLFLIVGFFIAVPYYLFAGILFGLLAFFWFQYSLNFKYVDDNWICLGSFCLLCSVISTVLLLLVLQVNGVSLHDDLFWMAAVSGAAGTVMPRILIPKLRPGRIKKALWESGQME